jgi:phosphoesterase RecJ-like protein
VSTLNSEDFDRLGGERSETENLVNRLREIRGVEVGVLITELPSGLTRVSFRSKNRLNVAALAQSLGGGGHHNAAGLRTPLPPSAIKQRIVQAVAEALSLSTNSVSETNASSKK